MRTYFKKFLIVFFLFLVINIVVKAEDNIKEYHYIWAENQNIFNKDCKQCNDSNNIYYLGKLVVDEDKKDVKFFMVNDFHKNYIERKIQNAVLFVNDSIKKNKIENINDIYTFFESYPFIKYYIYEIPNEKGNIYFKSNIKVLEKDKLERYFYNTQCRACRFRINVKENSNS